MDIGWHGITTMDSIEITCGHCGKMVGSDRGFFSNSKLDGVQARIYVCPHCARPTFLHKGLQIPDVSPGNEVNHVPEEVHSLYNEARKSIACSCYTASVLASRKLLMNIAVEEGAKKGLHFIEYIEFLADNNFVPPKGRGWVDHIRKKGNEATHEIPAMDHDDATELVSFSEMLLKFIYEFPAQIPNT
jgi:uncharacterized protein DUF4145